MNARAGRVDLSTRTPAGMARLEEPRLMIGVQPIFTDIEFDLDSNTTFTGGDGGQMGGFAPALGTYYVRPLNDRWAAGVAMAGIAGGAFDIDSDWAGRSLVTDLNLVAIGLNPVVSYRVNDWLSIGAGVSLNYGVIDFKLALLRLANQIDPSALRSRLSSLAPALQATVAQRLQDEAAGKVPPQLGPLLPNLPPAAQARLKAKALSQLSSKARAALEPALEKISRASDFLAPGPDGEMEIDGADDFVVNFNVGILIEPNERTRFGISYRSKVDFDFTGDFNLKDIPPLYRALGIQEGDIDMEVPIPQMVRASVYHQLTDTVALMGDIGWEDWSEMEYTPLSGPGGALIEIPRNWHDTWHFGLGAEWRARPAWLLQTGVAFDTSPIRDRRHNLPDMPSDRQWRFSAGFVYNWSESVTVGLNYTYIDFGRSPINSNSALGRFEGDYDKFVAHVVSASVEF